MTAYDRISEKSISYFYIRQWTSNDAMLYPLRLKQCLMSNETDLKFYWQKLSEADELSHLASNLWHVTNWCQLRPTVSASETTSEFSFTSTRLLKHFVSESQRIAKVQNSRPSKRWSHRLLREAGVCGMGSQVINAPVFTSLGRFVQQQKYFAQFKTRQVSLPESQRQRTNWLSSLHMFAITLELRTT